MEVVEVRVTSLLLFGSLGILSDAVRKKFPTGKTCQWEERTSERCLLVLVRLGGDRGQIFVATLDFGETKWFDEDGIFPWVA